MNKMVKEENFEELSCVMLNISCHERIAFEWARRNFSSWEMIFIRGKGIYDFTQKICCIKLIRSEFSDDLLKHFFFLFSTFPSNLLYVLYVENT